jgi:hypothetical protein
MAQPKRIIALVLMTLVATVVPATYQKGLEPRLEAANCRISIQALVMDDKETIDGKVVFYCLFEN